MPPGSHPTHGRGAKGGQARSRRDGGDRGSLGWGAELMRPIRATQRTARPEVHTRGGERTQPDQRKGEVRCASNRGQLKVPPTRGRPRMIAPWINERSAPHRAPPRRWERRPLEVPKAHNVLLCLLAHGERIAQVRN